MLKRVKFLSIPVADQSRALEFYTAKLGLKVATDQSFGGMRWIELQIPGAETLIVLHHTPDHVASDKVPAAALVADNVQSTYDELKAKGVEFVQPPQKEHWGEYAMLKDTEGNLVLFSKS